MRRVCTGSQLATFGTPSAASGTPGYFNPAAPGIGVTPTVPGPDWFNSVQEELAAVVTAVNLSLDTTGTSNAQVLQAIRRLLGGNATAISASTTLTADNAGDVFVNAAGGNVTITLPAAAAISGDVAGTPVSNSLPIRILRTDASGNNVTVVPGGADVLVGPGRGTITQVFVPTGGAGFEFWGNGSNGWIFAAFGPQPHGSAFSNTPGAFNWTVPAGVYFAEVEAWDAGAGGGYGAASNAGAGGGAGGYFRGIVPVNPGDVMGCTVGTPGGGGTSGSVNGAAASVGTGVVWSGGGALFPGNAGGGQGNSGSAGAGGGAPSVSGLAGGTYVALNGGNGTALGATFGGAGGASFGGAGQISAATGYIGQTPGAGGGGGANGHGGSAGNAGAIWWRW